MVDSPRCYVGYDCLSIPINKIKELYTNLNDSKYVITGQNIKLDKYFKH